LLVITGETTLVINVQEFLEFDITWPKYREIKEKMLCVLCLQTREIVILKCYYERSLGVTIL